MGDYMAEKAKRKLDLNEATREELIDVLGLGAKQADSILKRREEHGRFASLDDLRDINGIGQATVDGLKEMVAIGGDTAEDATNRVVGMTGKADEAARQVTAAASDAGAQKADETAGKVREIGQEMVQRNADAAERVLPGSGEAAAGATKVVALWASYWPEQIGENMRAVNRLAGCRSFGEAIEVQNTFARNSYERFAQRFNSLMELAMHAGVMGARSAENEVETRFEQTKATARKGEAQARR